MNERLTIQDLTDLLAAKHSMTKKDAEAFVKEFFLLIEEALENEKYVKIKGLGTFKLIDVDSRESVNVNTGERFQIKGHTKVSFTPDASIKDTVNKPFAHFETVVLNDNTVLEDTPLEEAEGESEEEETYGEAPLETSETSENKGELVEDNALKEEVPEKPVIKEDEVVVEQIVVEENRPEEIQIVQEQNPEPEFVEKKPELSAEQIISQELQKANLKHVMPKVKPQMAEPATVSNLVEPKKEKSPVAFLITIIVVVLILCGGAILFIYYPNLFSSSPEKETLDMPTVTETVKPEAQLMDTIHKDTVAKITPEVVQPTVKEEVKAPVKPETKPQPEASSVYSDNVTYTITGTKATHTIKEGESLTKVSLRYYGTKALWPYIVKHNPVAIKNPDNVPFGTTIKIPELTKK